MAFPKKGLRKITVDGVKYAYSVKGNDYDITFSIGLLKKNSALLTGRISYHYNRIPCFNENGKANSWRMYKRVKITPNTIRQIIEYGRKNGWKPEEQKGQYRFRKVGDKIELNLKAAVRFPKLEKNQVAMILVALKSGRTLCLDKTTYEGDGEIYRVFEILEKAKAFAQKTVDKHSEIACWILKTKNQALFYISSEAEKEF